MNPAIASRIPLVCRHKPPGGPLNARIEELTAQAVGETAGASYFQVVARAGGVFNFAALIVSDTGLPGLAEELCWRQYQIFADAGSLEPDIAVMALMPLVNIARLLIREGDGTSAYNVIQQLYRAARHRGQATIRGRSIDLAPLTDRGDAHRKACEELWAALLIDGARALAQAGRWTEAAAVLARHRGIGNRLLDGRQVKIMALLQQGLTSEAADLIESTVTAEPWEDTVAAMLRCYCLTKHWTAGQTDLARLMDKVVDLVTRPEPTTAVFRTRVGLTMLDLASGRPMPGTSRLREVVVGIGSTDAYAARDILSHDLLTQLTPQQHSRIAATLTRASLGAGHLLQADMDTITRAIDQAEGRLRVLLAPGVPSAR